MRKVVKLIKSLIEGLKAIGFFMRNTNYFWLFLFLTIFFGWFVFFRLEVTANPNAIHFLLSAISQGLATILAIVFTISLVAGQLASRYSPRMMRLVFKRSSLFYMLLFVSSVVFSLVGLVRTDVAVEIAEFRVVFLGHMRITWGSISLISAGACLAFLIPYFFSLTRRLTPERLLGDLGADGRKELIRTQGKVMPGEANDIRETLMDLYGLRYYSSFDAGLIELRNLAIFATRFVVEVEGGEGDEEGKRPVQQVVSEIMDMIGRIGALTIDDPLAPVMVVKRLGECAIAAATRLEASIDELTEDLKDVVTEVTEKGRQGVVTDIVISLGHMAGGTVKKEEAIAIRMLRILAEIGTHVLEKGWRKAADQVVYALESVGSIATAEDSPPVEKEAALHLRLMYSKAAELDMPKVSSVAAHHLGRLGSELARTGPESSIQEALTGIGTIAWQGLDLRKRDQAELSIKRLNDIGRIVIKRGFPNATQEAISRLGHCCFKTFVCEEEWAKTLRMRVCKILSSLSLKAVQSDKKGFHSVVRETASLWQQLGELSKEKGDPDLISQAVQCLCDLGAWATGLMLPGELVSHIRAELKNLESKIGKELIEQGFRRSKADIGLSEFMRLYEQPSN